MKAEGRKDSNKSYAFNGSNYSFLKAGVKLHCLGVVDNGFFIFSQLNIGPAPVIISESKAGV